MTTTALDPEALVRSVEDPELPHVTIGDLGMVRSVAVDATTVSVVLTPTFVGCPATQQIRDDVESALRAAGFEPAVEFALAPAWTTDWITPEGHAKLSAAGIAPPCAVNDGSAGERDLGTLLDLPVACPRCGSHQTRRQSEFGATACKAPYVCNACKEPFEWFKPL